MRLPAVAVLATVLAALGAGGPAGAHTGGSTGYAAIDVDEDGGVRYSLTLTPVALPAVAQSSLRLARQGRPADVERLLDALRPKVRVDADDRPCDPGPGSLERPRGGTEAVTVVLEFLCPGPPRRLAIRDDTFDLFGLDHHTLARVAGPAGAAQFLFEPARREASFELARLTDDASAWSGNFLLLGIEHILAGYDHLLFLLSLLLRGGGLVSLLKIVTAFTVAHSITLALAVLDVVQLPDRLVEAVIALSIAYVAAENLFLRPLASRRWAVSFVFGLVHGFGFSSVLRELHLPGQGLVLSLLGFNLGVEIGQALVVVVVLPVLVWLRRTRWEPRMVTASSVAILLVGLVLFVERLLL